MLTIRCRKLLQYAPLCASAAIPFLHKRCILYAAPERGVRFGSEKYMNKNPYDAPTAQVDDSVEIKERPLSQQSGKKKLFVGMPGAVLCYLLSSVGLLSGLTKGLAILLSAYAIIGFIEILSSDKITVLSSKWDALPGWKKFIFSVLIIVFALSAAAALTPLLSAALN